MTTPALYNLSIWVGNSTTFTFRLKQDLTTPLDLTTSSMIMTIAHDGNLIELNATSGNVEITDAVNGEFTVTMTALETRAIKSSSASVTYEIERRVGSEQTTVLYGSIALTGGANVD